MILDTSLTSMTSMFMKEGDAQLVIRQYDMGNGKMLYETVNDHHSFAEPRIIEDVLIGLSGSSGFDDGSDVAEDTGTKLIAIKLR